MERLDFKVTQLNNATAAEMRKALVEFGHAAEGSMMAVVFMLAMGWKLEEKIGLFQLTQNCRAIRMSKVRLSV